MRVSISIISREMKHNSTTSCRDDDEKLVNKYITKTTNLEYIHRQAKNRIKVSSDILNIIYDEFNSLSSITDKWKTIITDFPYSTTLYSWTKYGVIKLPKKYTDSYKFKNVS